jgi:hypothetical protein
MIDRMIPRRFDPLRLRTIARSAGPTEAQGGSLQTSWSRLALDVTAARCSKTRSP